MITHSDPSRLSPTAAERVERIAAVLREHRGEPVRLQVIVNRLRADSLVSVGKTQVCRALNVLRDGFGWTIRRGYFGVQLEGDPPPLSWQHERDQDPFACLEGIDA
jgi:hypothetical protein